MRRVVFMHQGQRIFLPEGESLLGRGVGCRIRFNDPAVSRAHLRLFVAGGLAAVANLSGSNGTLLNGKRLMEPRQLRQGDELRVGYRRIRVAVVEVDEPEPDPSRPTAPTGPDPDELLGADEATLEAADTDAAHRVNDDRMAEEATLPGEEGWRHREGIQAALADLADQPVSLLQLARIKVHTCPRCRARISFIDSTCTQCGYSWPPGHPSSKTQEIAFADIKARKEPRYPVEVPVIYSSATLTVDAIVRDVSRGGMFIATQLLDPVGTPCELTALPDGHPAMHFSGVVAHVADTSGPARVAGIGIRFIGGSPESLRWLERTLSRYAEAVID